MTGYYHLSRWHQWPLRHEMLEAYDHEVRWTTNGSHRLLFTSMKAGLLAADDLGVKNTETVQFSVDSGADSAAARSVALNMAESLHVHSCLSSVYLICETPWDDRVVMKIGMSETPKARRSNLQTGNARKLDLRHWFPGGRGSEAWLHDWLQPYRTHGEWFDVPLSIAICVDRTFEMLAGGRR